MLKIGHEVRRYRIDCDEMRLGTTVETRVPRVLPEEAMPDLECPWCGTRVLSGGPSWAQTGHGIALVDGQ